MIERIESSAVIAVDGPFGSGKSVFVGMCAAHLRNRKVAVAEFNAWQQSHSRWPLIDLVSALGSDAMLVKRLVGIAVNLVWRTAKVGTRGLLDRDDFGTPEDAARFEEWKQIEEKRAEFREALTEVVAGADLSIALDLNTQVAAGDHAVMRMLAALIALDQFAGGEEFDVDAIDAALGDRGAASAIMRHMRNFGSPWARSSRDGMVEIIELAVVTTSQHE